MPTYEEQQAALRAQVPKGTAGAAELESQGFTDVGTQPIDTSQPSPATVQTGLSKVGTSAVGLQGEQIFDIFKGETKLEEPEFAKMGINVADIKEGTAPTGFQSKFAKGFQDANKALGDKAMDVSSTQGATLTSQYAPAKRNDLASTFIQQDEVIGGLVKAFQDFVSPKNQRTSLREEYSKILKDTGIEQLNLDLINMKAVIDGSEDDIRREITASGSGMATESQILALSAARNKSLIKNYNTLLETKNSKEKYLQTAIGLEQADRQSADQRFESMFNMGTKIFEMGQQMKKSATEAYDRITKAVGYDGLLQMTQNDPNAISAIERTLGFSSGGLQIAANQAQLARTQAEQKEKLEIQEKEEKVKAAPLERELKTEQITTEKAQRANIYSQIAERSQKTGDVKVKEEKAIKNQVGTANVVLGKVKEASDLVGIFSTGFAATISGFIGGTPAKNLKTKVDTIAANLSFDTLQAMRDASPTGGALGQVSEREIELLGATVASLDIAQSPAQLRKSLSDIKTHYTNWLGTIGYSVAPNGDIIPIKVK